MFSEGLPFAMPQTVTPVSTHEVISMKGDGSNSKVLAEYIWLGSSGVDIKSRTVCLDEAPASAEELPIAEIACDGAGSYEDGCEIYLQPKKIYQDPFRGGSHILVLCDVWTPPLACATADIFDALEPHLSNHRAACEEVMQQAAKQQPVFTMQQEYTLLSEGCPLSGGGFVMGPAPGVPIKNSAGLSDKATAAAGRKISELHMQACLSAGLSFSGSHATSTHQHCYKIGPCLGIDMADQLSLSKFLLHRIAEYCEAAVHYDLLGYSGGATGNKCTVQFSTANSRDPSTGLSAIQEMMERLHSNHMQHFSNCDGPYNADSGSSGSWHSSSGFSEHVSSQGNARFTVGMGNRHASIMVPTSTLLNKCGPILDRRPPAGSDPYLTTMLLVSSSCGASLPQSTLKAMQLAASLAAAATFKSCSAGLPIPSSQRPSLSCASFSSFGSDSMGSAVPSCSISGLSGSADSEDVLLSALDRLDGYPSPSCPILMGSFMFGEDEDACSDICSDASSPPMAGNTLASTLESEAMYFE